MFTTIREETMISWKFLQLKKLHLEWEKTYEMVSRTGNKHAVAGLVHHLQNETFILIEQYRYPVQQKVLELVAGLMDKNTTPENTLREEIIEETWYQTINRVEFLAHTTASAGALSETTQLYKVEISWNRGTQSLWDLEDITVHEIATRDFHSFLQWELSRWILIDPKVCMAVYMFLQKTWKIV